MMLKCCAPVLRTASYPRQFGEGEDDVFAGDIVPKTLELCLKQSTKCCAPHFSCPLGGDIPVQGRGGSPA